ncbi:MAG: hypothetical protein Q9164_007904, partial [Protoblastenia rupestris]
RHPEVYVMSDAANASIPLEIRQQFPCDDNGRVLWFTTPPLNNTVTPLDVVSPKNGKPLAHTPVYLAAKEKRKKLIEERKKQIQDGSAAADQSAEAENRTENDGHPSSKRRRIIDVEVDTLVLQTLTDQILNANKEWYKSQYGDSAEEAEAFDAVRAEERRTEVEAKKAYFEERRKVEAERKEKEKAMEGKVFRDDWDERH